MTHEPTCGIIEVNGRITVDDLAEFQKQYLPTEQETTTQRQRGSSAPAQSYSDFTNMQK